MTKTLGADILDKSVRMSSSLIDRVLRFTDTGSSRDDHDPCTCDDSDVRARRLKEWRSGSDSTMNPVSVVL